METNDLKELYNKMLTDYKNELKGESPNKFVNNIISALSISVKELVDSYRLSDVKKVFSNNIGGWWKC